MSRRIACFAMADATHFKGLLPVVAGLVAEGAVVRVWTAAVFRDAVQAAGAEWADLFAHGSVESVDDASRPLPARFVPFAAAFAEAIAREAAEFGTDLVVFSSFAFIGRVVAARLDLPFVTVLAGHVADGRAFRDRLAADPRVALDPRAEAAAERIAETYGLADTTPLSYVADPSPFLNIYKEPRQWLTADEEAMLGPLAFFGSLPAAQRFGLPAGRAARQLRRIYASFGTVIWRYFTEAATAALLAIADGIATLEGVELVIGLGNGPVPPEALARLKARATLLDFADQEAELAAADLFITHNGLGSTHEAIAAGVPMLSYPIFWDQPALAKRCEELGVALPLVPGAPLRGTVTPQEVRVAIDRATRTRPQMLEALATAQRWEAEAIAARPDIVRRLLAL